MKCLIVLACAVLSAHTAFTQTIRLKDSSDWWSINRTDPGRPSAKPSSHGLQPSNFEIAGVTLGHGSSDAITTNLGRVITVKRGDGAAGRSQFCYSPGPKQQVHLVFEFGEDESVVYLFTGGKSWNGDKYCAVSNKVSSALSTASGLRLGLSRAEVESILGQPDSVTSEGVVYFRDFQKKSTPEEFQVFRQEYPQKLSDQEAHRQFDYYPVQQYVLAKFANSKLVYLAITVNGEGD